MALAFKCKQCGHKYRNVSVELSGRKIRCECGRIQRLLTRDEKDRQETKKKKKRKKQQKLEVIAVGSSAEEKVYDLISNSVAPSRQFSDSLADHGAGEVATELTNESELPDSSETRISTLPTMPPGYFRNAYQLTNQDLPDPKLNQPIGVVSGAAAAILGILLIVVSVRMVLAGASGNSFLDPINRLNLSLCNDAGVRIAAFAIFAAAIGLLIGGMGQFTTALEKPVPTESRRVWPDLVVLLAGLSFVLFVFFDLAILNQVKNKKLQFREVSLVKSVRNAENRGKPLDSPYLSEQQLDFEETRAAANRGMNSLLVRSLPLCAIALLVAVLSWIHYRNTRRSAIFT